MKSLIPLALAATLAATPANAAEIFGGLYKHAVDTPLSLEGGREQGVDVQFGYRGGRLFPPLGLQPYVFGALNSAGEGCCPRLLRNPGEKEASQPCRVPPSSAGCFRRPAAGDCPGGCGGAGCRRDFRRES